MPELNRQSEQILRHRVAEARRLLDEPLLIEAFDKVEHMAIEEILALPMGADRKRRILTDRVRTIRAVKAHLHNLIASGEQALKKPLRLA